MKFAVTSVQVTRQTRRRAGKSQMEIVDTDTDIYQQVLDHEETVQPSVVERIYEKFNSTGHTLCKVVDVRKVDESVLTKSR